MNACGPPIRPRILSAAAKDYKGSDVEKAAAAGTKALERLKSAAKETDPKVKRALTEARAEVRDLTATDLDYMRVSDEDIEKAIAELKEALRRGSSP